MAIFLHPHFKLAWFKKYWSDFEYNKAVACIHNEYSHAKKRFIERNPVAPKPLKATELDDFTAYNRLSSPSEDHNDDLERYKIDKAAVFDVNPLQWWIANSHLYPVLRDLTFTYLAAPASTVANERLFSIAGNVVNEERPHTQAKLAEAVRCLRSWHHEQLI
jgi:hypothetical protein